MSGERAGEAHVSRKALKDFPAQVGSWRQTGDDVRFDAETEKVLRADDYLSRILISGGRTAFVVCRLLRYATQNGATYHSPLIACPSGWVMGDPARILITPMNGGAPFEANRFRHCQTVRTAR